jgi:ArsR family transcriptional regulator
LTEALALPQSLLSFHLKTLRDAGLVTDRREGRWVYYALAPRALEVARNAIDALSAEVVPRTRAARC